jgi:hypothetical protein
MILTLRSQFGRRETQTAEKDQALSGCIQRELWRDSLLLRSKLDLPECVEMNGRTALETMDLLRMESIRIV